MHSNASDGSLSPKELIQYLAKLGISTFALTDHDTTAGLHEAQKYAKENKISFINGIEFEIASEDPGIMHVLALDFEVDHPSVQALCEKTKELRKNRNEAIKNKMNDDGIPIQEDLLAEICGPGQLSRPHFAEYLHRLGRVKNIQEAFDTYLGQGKPYYHPYEGLDLKTLCEEIHKASGLLVLAHPLSIYISWGRLESRLKTWKEAGLDGLESWHPSAKFRDAQRLEAMARELNLVCTAGSDFHNPQFRHSSPGKSLQNKQKIPDSFLDSFWAFKNDRGFPRISKEVLE